MSNAVTARLGTRNRQTPAPRPSSHRARLSHGRSFGRRGSALMVALALLLMLAVFASLFLTSSRFDVDASAADLDTVRMDLYAEGLFQYMQNCMVAGLWGFDEKPLNNDGTKPWTGVVPLPAVPGPDSPFDYYGGAALVSDADGSVAGGLGRSGDETFFYPDFWLTDPRVHGAAGAQVYWHPAFSPNALPPYDANLSTYTPAQKAQFWWQWADLDNDGRADAPWSFRKALPNGLVIRAAVRVEDTSSRVNINVANQPIPVGDDLAAVYGGYPADYPTTTVIPRLNDEIVGGFLSEFNLQGMLGAAQLDKTNGGDGANFPGRYGKRPTTAKAWPWAPDASSIPAYAPFSVQVPPSLRLLLGDTRTWAAGRLGNALGTLLDPSLGYVWNVSQGTFDPDGLARRLDSPELLATDEKDHAFGPDETFDLMSLLGYTKPAGMPTQTRLEALWPALSNAASPVPWRRLMTTYSWTANLCPYGEDPYGDKSYRKVNLNTCTAGQLRAAIAAANTHSLATGSALSDDQMDQLAVNVIAYRNRPMAAADLGIYLMSVHERFLVDPTTTTVTMPPPAWLEWDAAAWNTYVTTTQTLEPTKTEAGYLQALRQANLAAFWAEIANAINATPRISPARVAEMNRTAGGGEVYGLARSPFITEVWRDIQYPTDVTQMNDPTDITKKNDYAVELYNPWDTALTLDGWYLRVRNSAAGDIVIGLAGQSIAAKGRFVVRRQASGPGIVDASLIIAMQLPTTPGLIVELVYSPTGGDYAIFDAVPEAELADFAGGDPASPVASSGAKFRRDDFGFWCYQRWYTDGGNSLGAANLATAPDDPWTVATHGPNPAVPVIGVGQILSPAEIALVPYGAPRQVHAGVEVGQTFADATKSTDITSEVARLTTLQFGRPMLFHRGYVQPTASTDDPVSIQSVQFAGVMQALLDFVTVPDFTEDGIDNNGDGKGAAATADLAEARIPGRLNINTIASSFTALDAAPVGSSLPLLPLTNPANARDGEFWQHLIDFRDRAGSYSLGRGVAAVGGTGIPGYADHAGVEQLGELCNLQLWNPATGEVAFQGFWQNRDIQGDGVWDSTYLLPAQHIRRFSANANLLSVRSDTYLATVRIEIVQPIYDTGGNLVQMNRLGQREFMYLADRSYCLQAPQQAPTAGDAMFNGRANPKYVPPRAWRMTIPRYPAYGG